MDGKGTMMNATTMLDTDQEIGEGFRPTDTELVHYLKLMLQGNHSPKIPVVDIYKYEPSDLPGEYFFCPRHDENRSCTKRRTKEGFWKSTGQDRVIKDEAKIDTLFKKKILVYHRGRSHSGKRTNWVIHEIRKTLDDGKTTQGGYVLCKQMKKPDENVKVSTDSEGEPSSRMAPEHDRLSTKANSEFSTPTSRKRKSDGPLSTFGEEHSRSSSYRHSDDVEDVEILQRDENVLMQELVRLRQQQQATDHQLETVGQHMQMMEQWQQQMMSFLAKAMQSPLLLDNLPSNSLESCSFASRITEVTLPADLLSSGKSSARVDPGFHGSPVEQNHLTEVNSQMCGQGEESVPNFTEMPGNVTESFSGIPTAIPLVSEISNRDFVDRLPSTIDMTMAGQSDPQEMPILPSINDGENNASSYTTIPEEVIDGQQSDVSFIGHKKQCYGLNPRPESSVTPEDDQIDYGFWNQLSVLDYGLWN